MKKINILFTAALCFLAIAEVLRAQIPNAGFEDWGGNDPVNWVSGNVNGYVFVSPSGDPLSGAYAAKMEAKSIEGFLVPAVLSAGPEGEGFPVNQRHGQLSFYYKFHKTVNTAYFIISAGFKKGEDGIGAGVLAINEPADYYTPVTIPITYINDEIPDLGVITFQVSDQFMSSAANGSYAVIDNLSFALISDVDEDAGYPESFSLEQNFPNPFNPSTKINFSVPSGGQNTKVELIVYDLLGNEAAVLVNETKEPGNYTAEFNAENFPSGVYFYKLQAGNFTAVKKMLLIK